MCECSALAQLPSGRIPWQKVEPMLPNPVEESLLDRVWIRGRIWTASKADGPKSPAASWCHRPGRGIEISIVARLDAIGEQLHDSLLVDRRGRQDPRSGGVPGDFADCEPLAACKRGRRVEAETAAADRLPGCTGGITAT
jgi:hypothetical protein